MKEFDTGQRRHVEDVQGEHPAAVANDSNIS